MSPLFWIIIGLVFACALLSIFFWRSHRYWRSQNNQWRQRVEKNERVLRALSAGGEELWEINPKLNTFTRLCNSLRVANANDGDVLSIGELSDTAHPGDRWIIEDAINEAMLKKGEIVEVNYRSKGADGRWLWILVRGRTVKTNNNETLIVGASRDITTIKANAQRLQLALQSAKEELWELDLSTNTLTRENILRSLDLADVVTNQARESIRDFIHPEDRDVLVSAFGRAIQGQQGSFGAAYRARQQDGSFVWLDSQGTATDFDERGFPARIIGTTRDISNLKEHEAVMRLALWGSQAELWDVDVNNGTLQREFMLENFSIDGSASSEGEMIRNQIRFRDVIALLHPDDRERFKSQMKDRIFGQLDSFEVVFRLKNKQGVWRWMSGRSRVMGRNVEGRVARFVGTLQDIDDIKQAEENLRVLNEALEQRVSDRTSALTESNLALQYSINELQSTQRRMVDAEKMAALGGLVAGVAHEINTPIGVAVTAASHIENTLKNSLKKNAESLDTGELTKLKSVSDAADIVLRNLRRADQLIKSFKQVAIDQTSEQPRHINLREYLDEILIALKPAFKRKPIEIKIHCNELLMIYTYPGAIYQIISNLVLNSIKHGFIDDRSARIDISAGQKDARFFLEYRDNGVGMSEAIRSRIFEPFFTTKRGSGGSGLGLHIVFNLVHQRLQGHIEVETKTQEGCVFRIDFPGL